MRLVHMRLAANVSASAGLKRRPTVPPVDASRAAPRRPARARPCSALTLVGIALTLAACGSSQAADARFPPRPAGCAVQLYRGKVAGIAYDDVGRVDAICGNELGEAACLDELRNQTCKLGGDLVYDVPDEPQRPSPDKVRFTGRVAHTRAPSASKPPP